MAKQDSMKLFAATVAVGAGLLTWLIMTAAAEVILYNADLEHSAFRHQKYWMAGLLLVVCSRVAVLVWRTMPKTTGQVYPSGTGPMG